MPRNAGLFVCDNFHILRDTVRKTDCTWITSPAFLADDLRDGRLVQLEVADLAPANSEICVVFKRGRTRSPAAVAVTEEVRRMLERMSE
jgi:DNA-binding transcriptional LysR family regulator